MNGGMPVGNRQPTLQIYHGRQKDYLGNVLLRWTPMQLDATIDQHVPP